MKIVSYGITDRGRRRELNEDYFICDSEKNIYVVADGMGGEVTGEIASKMAVETFLGKIYPFLQDEEITLPFEVGPNGDYISSAIKYAIEQTNTVIYQHGMDHLSSKGMGTTFTVAIPHGTRLYVGHIGDTRLYQIRRGEITQLSEDHTMVQQMVKEGRLTSQEARCHPKKNIITRSLGPKRKIRLDAFSCDLLLGDMYLLCSDGLYQMVEEGEFFSELSSSKVGSLETIGKSLVSLANERGGKDNITLVLFKLEDDQQEKNG